MNYRLWVQDEAKAEIRRLPETCASASDGKLRPWPTILDLLIADRCGRLRCPASKRDACGWLNGG